MTLSQSCDLEMTEVTKVMFEKEHWNFPSRILNFAIKLLKNFFTQPDVRLWQIITDKCEGNLKFNWTNSSAGRILKFCQ